MYTICNGEHTVATLNNAYHFQDIRRMFNVQQRGQTDKKTRRSDDEPY